LTALPSISHVGKWMGLTHIFRRAKGNLLQISFHSFK